jgi:hypothetical protein
VRLEGGVEQDVVGLDVAVDDPGCAVVVEVAESARGLPPEVSAVQHLFERDVGHELVVLLLEACVTPW